MGKLSKSVKTTKVVSMDALALMWDVESHQNYVRCADLFCIWNTYLVNWVAPAGPEIHQSWSSLRVRGEAKCTEQTKNKEYSEEVSIKTSY